MNFVNIESWKECSWKGCRK